MSTRAENDQCTTMGDLTMSKILCFFGLHKWYWRYLGLDNKYAYRAQCCECCGRIKRMFLNDWPGKIT